MLTEPKAGTTHSKLSTLRRANWILAASIVVALISIVLGLAQNRRLALDNKQLQFQLEKVAQVAPCDPARIGDIVPPIEADSSEGRRIALTFNGTSRHLLFIFSSTCGECLSQFSNWNEIATKARSKNLVVLGLWVDSEPANINASNLSFTVLRTKDAAILRAYRVDAVPSVMVISENGRTQWVRSGSLSEAGVRELFSVIDGVTVFQ